ncbi:MAG: hypothetical protein LBT97_06565 [Planctomycetota bacterium]|nr:hypothetical protein [Planctomycetota bacterium]
MLRNNARLRENAQYRFHCIITGDRLLDEARSAIAAAGVEVRTVEV